MTGAPHKQTHSAADRRGHEVDVVAPQNAGCCHDGGDNHRWLTAAFHCNPGYYHLVVALQGDEVRGLHPLLPQRRTWKPEELPAHYPAEGKLHHWKQLFFSKDAPIKDARPWMGWDHMWKDLNSVFGDRSIARDIGVMPDDRRDKRIEQLAGWADYHRTHVYVNYKNVFAFRILPRFAARGHHRAKLGRCIKIELGDEGARMYFTSPKRMYTAYNDIFVADAMTLRGMLHAFSGVRN